MTHQKLSPAAKLIANQLDKRYPRMMEIFHPDVVRSLIDAALMVIAVNQAPPDAPWSQVRDISQETRAQLLHHFGLEGASA